MRNRKKILAFLINAALMGSVFFFSTCGADDIERTPISAIDATKEFKITLEPLPEDEKGKVAVTKIAAVNNPKEPYIAKRTNEVTLTITNAIDRKLDSLHLQYGDTWRTFKPSSQSGLIASIVFTMPPADVTVYAYFGDKYFKIAPPSSDGGVIASDFEFAKAGDLVTLTIIPDEGKILKSKSLTAKAGTGTTITNIPLTIEDDTATFTVPNNIAATASEITIAAEFEDAPISEEDGESTIGQYGFYTVYFQNGYYQRVFASAPAAYFP